MAKFGWCLSGDHDHCIRKFQRFYITAKNKVVMLDEFAYCSCDKPGCKCSEEK